jgi:hypothetical protein
LAAKEYFTMIGPMGAVSVNLDTAPGYLRRGKYRWAEGEEEKYKAALAAKEGPKQTMTADGPVTAPSARRRSSVLDSPTRISSDED